MQTPHAAPRTPQALSPMPGWQTPFGSQHPAQFEGEHGGTTGPQAKKMDVAEISSAARTREEEGMVARSTARPVPVGARAQDRDVTALFDAGARPAQGGRAKVLGFLRRHAGVTGVSVPGPLQKTLSNSAATPASNSRRLLKPKAT